MHRSNCFKNGPMGCHDCPTSRDSQDRGGRALPNCSPEYAQQHRLCGVQAPLAQPDARYHTLWDVSAVRLREQRIWMRYNLALSTTLCCHHAGRLHQSWCVSGGSSRARSFSSLTLIRTPSFSSLAWIRSPSFIQSATVRLCAIARGAWSLRNTAYRRAFAALAAADSGEYVVCSDWLDDRFLLMHLSCARIPIRSGAPPASAVFMCLAASAIAATLPTISPSRGGVGNADCACYTQS
jgi:hypothetical protein